MGRASTVVAVPAGNEWRPGFVEASTAGVSRAAGDGPVSPAQRARLHPSRIVTRRRLFAAFAVLGVTFVAAFASQLAGLDDIERVLDELQAEEVQMRLALELEGAVRDQFAHQAHLVVGEGYHLDQYRAAQERAVRLAASLAASVHDPEDVRSVAEIDAAMRELDRIFREQIVPVGGARAADAARAHELAYPLFFRVEENADRIFASLRDRAVAQTGAVHAVHRTSRRLAVTFSIAVPVLAVLLALYLSRSIARPLAVIGEGAAGIAGGDLSTRIALSGTDEFGTLAAELNLMAETLGRDREALVRSEKLAGLGRVAAGIAHELNDPLQVMIGYLTLHRDRVGGELGTHLARVEREATRCRDIVEALLDLARPAAFVTEPVDLREVADEVAEAVRTAAGSQGPRIRVEGEVTALGTRARLRQVAFNLARNAADAAGPGGTVELRVGRDGDRAWLSVLDDGPGVPEEARARIFEPFFTTKPAGAGLGLAIVRAIAMALGGEIALEQRRERGACFTLRVPATKGGG